MRERLVALQAMIDLKVRNVTEQRFLSRYAFFCQNVLEQIEKCLFAAELDIKTKICQNLRFSAALREFCFFLLPIESATLCSNPSLATLSFALCSALTCRLLLAGTAKFFIRNYSGRGDFNLDIKCRGALRGAELREEIAKEKGWKKEDLELKQKIGKRKNDDAIVVYVGGDFYADEEGEETRAWDCEDEEEVVIHHKEEVLEAGPQRAWIEVYQRESEF